MQSSSEGLPVHVDIDVTSVSYDAFTNGDVGLLSCVWLYDWLGSSLEERGGGQYE